MMKYVQLKRYLQWPYMRARLHCSDVLYTRICQCVTIRTTRQYSILFYRASYDWMYNNKFPYSNLHFFFGGGGQLFFVCSTYGIMIKVICACPLGEGRGDQTCFVCYFVKYTAHHPRAPINSNKHSVLYQL